MKNSRSSRFVFLFLVCGLLFVLAACGAAQAGQGNPSPAAGNGTMTASGTPSVSRTSTSGNGTVTASGTPSVSGTSTPSPQVTTTPVPSTQTSCPPDGTVRPAVMPPLASGSDPNLVYTYDESPADPFTNPSFLKRYDITSGQKQVIVSGQSIDHAQVSADGQWVLFTSTVNRQTDGTSITALQLVRMDGQGLQTLYCTTQWIEQVNWSTNQQFVALNFLLGGGTQMDLLNINTGVLQTELTVNTPPGLALDGWLDNTHLYLNTTLDGYPTTLYLLDTSKGANQTDSDLTTVSVTPAHAPFTFDTSFDASQLYSALCQTRQEGSFYGPSTIAVQPSTGGQAQPIYTSPTYAVTEVHAVTPTTLLFLINNVALPGQQTDTSHNGWWKINIDGTGLTPLNLSTNGQSFEFGAYTESPWSDLSRDGHWYAFISYTGSSASLMFAPLSGGAPTKFASAAIYSVAIAGWTTM